MIRKALLFLISCTWLQPMGLGVPVAGRMPGVDSSSRFLVYYGSDFGPSNLEQMSRFDVVVIDANADGVTPSVVAHLQDNGVRYVLAYITIGEDDGTLVIGNGEGPVRHDGNRIVESSEGIASFYVDQEWNGSEYVSDGAADTNSFFGGRFVHPNDDWRWVLNTQRIGGSPGLPDRSMAGLEQIAGPRQSDSDTSKLNDFGFDGFFLDTIDTAGPFAEVLGYYPWAAEEMSRTVRFIHEAYPDMILMANRGVFFYNPAQADPVFDVRPFDYTLRPYIHAVVFESYLLDNDPSQGISPYFGDNKHNYGPKLMAEANRMDGFTVFSIDYQVGRGSALYDLAVEESVVRNGWIPFLAQDVLLDAVDTYVIDHPAPPDTAPPEWDSTGSPGFSLEDVPDRIGIQAVLAGPGAGEVLIQWDTARDQSLPIRYHVYQSTDPTFSVNVVKHANVDYQTGEGWNQDPASAYANQFTISGLGLDTYHFRVRAEDSLGLEEDNEVTLSITLSSPVTAVTNPGVSISIDGGLSDWTGLIPFEEDPEELGGPGNIIDWKQLLLGHDGAMLFIAYRNHGAVSLDWGHNLYLDVDSSRSSGFRGGGDDYPLGAEFLLQGSYLHRYLGNGTSWEWGYVGQARSAVSQEIAELMIPRAWIDRPVGMRLFLLGDNHPHGAASTDLYPDGALGSAGSGAWLQYDFARISNPVSALTVDGNLDDWQGLRFFGSDPVDAPGSGNQLDWRRLGIGHDAADLYFAYENNGPVSLNWAYNVYLDVDGALTTGFRGGGAELPVGAEYLLQGIHLYRYSGSGTGWSWTFVGTAGVGLSGSSAELRLPRVWLDGTDDIDLFLLGDNTAYPGGSGIDQYPDRSVEFGPEEGGRFFSYSTSP